MNTLKFMIMGDTQPRTGAAAQPVGIAQSRAKVYFEHDKAGKGICLLSGRSHYEHLEQRILLRYNFKVLRSLTNLRNRVQLIS